MKVQRLCSVMAAVLGITGASTAAGEPLPGGSLDPTTIPKFTTPLVIPPQMPKTSTTATGDYYEIAVRQFSQQILPAPLPPTTVWSYGSANHPGSFHYPAFTVETTRARPVTVKWINDLVDEQGNFLPHLLPVDQTLHWANPAQQCADGRMATDCVGDNPARYEGPVPMVTHVHGARVRAESDGYPEAWWLPAAADIPAGFAERGSRWGQATGYAPTPGAAVFSYGNNQPSTTLWYHDHTLGMTRLNVYAGPAGFWLIRDRSRGETGLRRGVLPGPAPRAGDAPGTRYYEIPIAIQDRAFNQDGSLFYPDHRAFFENMTPEQLQIPFRDNDPSTPPSDIAGIWNPEVFANVMVVNGRSWPYLDVDRGRYRLRLLNGCNSRFLNLALRVVNGDGSLGQELPIYQIGGDQSLLADVVEIRTGSFTVHDDETRRATTTAAPHPMQALLMAPAERADVIVDFGSLAAGTRVRLINTAPDAPFGGFPDAPADPQTTGQVMEFVVGAAAGPTFTHPSKLQLSDGTRLPAPAAARQLTLNEQDSALVCVQAGPDESLVYTGAPPCAEGSIPFGPESARLGTVDAMGMPMAMAWMDPITENPALGALEEWELQNCTMDAHPIHLHLVKFQVVNRQPLHMGMCGMGVTGAAAAPLPNESGWKDTVIAYPGEVTRIRAVFDIPGLYVWHCHIVEHEDNEMMRPYCVGTPGVHCPADLFGTMGMQAAM